VARKFPIIRFDAAMTLTRKHYQRLWYPQPGSGGDIPSRSGMGMSHEQFNSYMPNEFWRDVVDRVAREVPDTLLLAEAFWLMESYFVRNLGMHRVYNSAFMHFLKDEDNGKFRTSLKNVLEFNPEILKRFVNFMNNPDEETALAQFGKGDKYFGTCTLLATLPGLPMFGHGQIEGFGEKYVMEYRKAYRDERPDRDFIRRHEQQIFPLLKKRSLFSGVRHFLLYDFFTAAGVVDENVIAFSNRHQDERCLVVYHNCFGHAFGSLRMSAAFVQEGSGASRPLIQKSIAQGLELPEGHNQFVVFRDMVTQLKYIRNCRQLHAQGLAIELGSYQTHVFIDFKEMVDDASGSLARLDAYLHGRGTDSLERTGREMSLQPMIHALHELCQKEILKRQREVFHSRLGSQDESALWQELEEKTHNLISLASGINHSTENYRKTAETILEELLAMRMLMRAEQGKKHEQVGNIATAEQFLKEQFLDDPETESLFILLLYISGLVEAGGEKRPDGRALFEEWMLDRELADILRSLDFAENNGEAARLNIRIACGLGTMITSYINALVQAGESVAAATGKLINTMVTDEDVQFLLQLHRSKDDLFFNREAFEKFCAWLSVLMMWELSQAGKKAPVVRSQSAGDVLNVMNFMPVLAAKADYKLDLFLKQLALFAAE
jgi:hypothetical protein